MMTKACQKTFGSMHEIVTHITVEHVGGIDLFTFYWSVRDLNTTLLQNKCKLCIQSHLKRPFRIVQNGLRGRGKEGWVDGKRDNVRSSMFIRLLLEAQRYPTTPASGRAALGKK